MLNKDILLAIALKCHNIRQFHNMNEIIYCKDEIQEWMIEKIHKRLEQKGLNATEFVAKMIESQGVMSGSLILQCLYDEEYDGSDIDIFTPKYSNFKNYAERYMCKSEGAFRQSYGATDANVNRIHYYHFDNYKIRIIGMEEKVDIYDHINNFDFDVCSMTYDGYKVSAINWTSVINKEININNRYAQQCEMLLVNNRMLKINMYDALLYRKNTFDKRIAKYKMRGFTFIGDANSDMFDEYLQ